MNIPPTLSPLPFVPCRAVDTAVRDARGNLVAYFYGEHGHMNREIFLVLANGAEAAIDAVRSDIEDQEGTIETMKSEIAEAEEARDEAEEEARIAKADVRHLGEQNGELRSEIKDLKTRIAGLETETADQEAALLAYQGR